jgi:hypothetical protein
LVLLRAQPYPCRRRSSPRWRCTARLTYATNTVGREEVAAFVGSVAGAKGVFVTTSTFTKRAIEFAREKHKNVVLIDGQKLGELMLRCGLGVNEKRTYRVSVRIGTTGTPERTPLLAK